ncbi:hypothetical protein EVAR_37435_1 [Eumeta japonica]|uniref:Uncharacterized protein n=1 Tax=Eumeta variegata TaxID=151549 RepID=A0A4C1X4I4_EUMVA|nr:hypothetical protein EVAR_37435_1 [Eumeta japonica]
MAGKVRFLSGDHESDVAALGSLPTYTMPDLFTTPDDPVRLQASIGYSGSYMVRALRDSLFVGVLRPTRTRYTK